MKNGSLLTVVLLFVFTSSLFSATRTWIGPSPGVWDGTTPANWSGGAVPGAGDNVVIASGDTVSLQTSVSIISIDIGDGTGNSNLTIDATYTLTTMGSSDGVFIVAGPMAGSENSLVVNGNLIINGSTGDGIESREFTSLSVGSGGSITINSPGDHGMEIYSEFINSGTITITDPVDSGFSFKAASAGSTIINNSSGEITVTSAGTEGIHLTNGDITFTNDGTLNLTNDNPMLGILENPGTLINNGTVKGNGKILGGSDFVANNSSRLAPGTSIGKFTFYSAGETQDLKDIFFDIEIEGSTTPGVDYDQIASAENSVDIDNSVLNLIEGSYTPMAGDIFKIIDVPTGFSLNGTFNGIPEGGSVTFKGVTLYFSYAGGDGNDFTASFDAPLPVELIDFNARAMEGEVKVSWTTANEENNDYFTLERSPDGRNFEAIAMVLGNGNTTEISKYTHMDKDPTRGLSYYRLKQTDYDGTFSYSDLETVEFEGDAEVQVYPTAVHDVLTIETGSDLDGETTIIIRDIAGRTFKAFNISTKSNKTEITLNDLIPGSYFITIYNNQTIQTQKIIKL